MKEYSRLIKEYSKEAYSLLKREPAGLLKHPFLVPGKAYSSELWDWDSWLTDVAIRQIMLDNNDNSEEFFEYEKGCVLNFLDYKPASGRMAIMISSVHGDSLLSSSKNAHKPCLLQHVAFIIKRTGDSSWIKDRLPELREFLHFYKTKAYHEPTGLYFWGDDIAIGVDNDPCVFYRPDGSTASVYLNCLMYKELLAFAYVLTVLGKAEEAKRYEEEAKALSDAINEHLYDEKCGMYYSADINLNPIEPDKLLHSGMPRHWDSLIMRIDSWAGFMALWAGIVPADRAKRVIEENMLNERTFMSQCGVRSLSRLEKMYRIIKSGNPSCWLGPVWGISNYMCFRGLLKYGYEREAVELAEKTVKLFGEDVKNIGEMHEYYDPDSSMGVNNPGFQSWNLLVNNMLAFLEGREVVEEF
jgi:putative isomerase